VVVVDWPEYRFGSAKVLGGELNTQASGTWLKRRPMSSYTQGRTNDWIESNKVQNHFFVPMSIANESSGGTYLRAVVTVLP
jgi:hypothetical protein